MTEEMKRTMILVPKDLAVWLAGTKVKQGVPVQQLINASVAFVQKHNLVEVALGEYGISRPPKS